MVSLLAGLITYQQSTAVTPLHTIDSVLPRVTNRKPNLQGKVFVIMYHHIREGKNAMFRSPKNFRKDLENLYKAGFRPVTVTEYVTNKMNLQPGASPVVMTFDDAHPNQFYYLKDGRIDPKCAVGIWEDFARTHPDFPVKATWYMLPVMWGQKKLIQKKVDFLKARGSELGNHTEHHHLLPRLSDAQVKFELAAQHARLVSYGAAKDMPFCPPYGAYPRNKSLVRSFTYNGKTIVHNSACLAWDGPAKSPNDKKFDKYLFDRIHGNERPMGIDYWLAKLKAGKVSPYVAP
ncbi:MAG TPA: polysaccharide deacetylase family protein [Fimbriimonas sp.]|nr:polysaccharide deacetylase family protein [Fimbriimonas sp.]